MHIEEMKFSNESGMGHSAHISKCVYIVSLQGSKRLNTIIHKADYLVKSNNWYQEDKQTNDP